MKKWGRYEIAGSPDEAELIVELSYRVVDEGTRVWSSTNTYNNTTQVHSRQVVDPQLVLTIYDAKTKTSLWSETDTEGWRSERKTGRKRPSSRRQACGRSKNESQYPTVTRPPPSAPIRSAPAGNVSEVSEEQKNW